MGAVISALLIWGLYVQVRSHVAHLDWGTLSQTGQQYLLWLCIALMPVNLVLEAWKWKLLAGSAQPLSFGEAFSSLLGGIAFSMITPNRIGEYPGRILYLKRKNTFRLISVSILGAVAQMLTLFIYGLAGIIYYNMTFPGLLPLIILILAIVVTVGIGVLYWSFERWAPLFEKIKWLRKFHVYGQLLKRFTNKEQWIILLISMLRYSIYTAQYLILLKWMNVNLPVFQGFLMCALFFWVIAVMPSIALAELGQRGQVSLFLFRNFSDNLVGILGATAGIWCINLVLPALVGSVLLFRMRLFRNV